MIIPKGFIRVTKDRGGDDILIRVDAIKCVKPYGRGTVIELDRSEYPIWAGDPLEEVAAFMAAAQVGQCDPETGEVHE